MSFLDEKLINDHLQLFIDILRKEETTSNLYYAKGAVQSLIRSNSQTFTQQFLTEMAKYFLEKSGGEGSEEEYMALLLGVVCGERIRIQNVGIFKDEYNGNLERLNELLYKEYAQYLHYPNLTEQQKEERYKKWLKIVSGNVDYLEITNENEGSESGGGEGVIVQYSDHVTRMQSVVYNRPEKLHTFVIPTFARPNDFETIEFSGGGVREYEYSLERVLNHMDEVDKKILTQKLEPFSYERLEDSVQGSEPIIFENTCTFNNFNSAEFGKKVGISCLHMPLKLSKDFCNQFNEEGRRLPNGESFDPNKLYIPTEIAGDDMMKALKFSCDIERQIDKDRFENNFVLLTLRTDTLQREQSLGNTGWHIDGHQGVERIQKNGKKVPIDRQYCVSNILPTQVIGIRLDLDPVRELAKKEALTLDQYNIQSIIQRTIEKCDTSNIQEVPANKIFYANPYMFHQSQVNHTNTLIERHFARILFTVDERDRIGDTINPLFGPIYPFKIKQIVDIKQFPEEMVNTLKFKV